MKKTILAFGALFALSSQASVCIVSVSQGHADPTADYAQCDGKEVSIGSKKATTYLQQKIDAGYKILSQSQDQDGNLLYTLSK